MKELRDDRTDRAARHDDRPFRAERAARADRDGGRKRFQHASLGCTLLPLIRIDSIASGMPWPRMRSEPYRAIAR